MKPPLLCSAVALTLLTGGLACVSPTAANPTTRPTTASVVVPLRSFRLTKAPPRPADGVFVDVHPPTLEPRRFDPVTMPPDLVRGAEGYEATTRWSLPYPSWWWYTSLLDDEQDGKHTVLIRMDAVHVGLWCHTTMFLPDTANDLLRRHEHAHRRIAEQAYASAPGEARRIARSMMGQRFVGRGDTAAAAERAALDAASDAFNAAYQVAVIDRVSAVQDAFDFLTQHNENPKLRGEANVDRAIAVAWAIASFSKAERAYGVMVGDGPPLVPLTIDLTQVPAAAAATKPSP